MTHKLAGKTFTATVWFYRDVSWDKDDYMDGSFCIDNSDPCKNSPDNIALGSQEVSITVPDDFDPVPQQVAALLAKKAEITAEFTKAVSDLNRQLSELQALPNEVEA